jgi:hypothetical protein
MAAHLCAVGGRRGRVLAQPVRGRTASSLGGRCTPRHRRRRTVVVVSSSTPGIGSTGTRAPVVRGQRPWQERTASAGLGHRPYGRSDQRSRCTPSSAAPQPQMCCKEREKLSESNYGTHNAKNHVKRGHYLPKTPQRTHGGEVR